MTVLYVIAQPSLFPAIDPTPATPYNAPYPISRPRRAALPPALARRAVLVKEV